MKSKHAFVLPNGKNLSYAWPHQAKGGQFKWNHSYLTDRLIHHKARTKERQIRVGLWTSRSEVHAVCADFDKLPHGFEDWDCFHRYAKDTWKDGFVYRTFNKKVKVLFVGKLDSGDRMNKLFAVNFLRERIGHEFFEYLDVGPGAVSTSFISGYQVERLGKWISKAKLFSIDTTIEKHKYIQENGEIPVELQNFVTSCPPQKTAREKFVRIILRMTNLNTNGFDLPTTKLGKECGVAAARISEWRAELEEMGWLRCTDESYCKGIKGMTYRARGALRKAIYAVARVMKKTLSISVSRLPGMIPDGSWESTLWEYSKFFVDRPDEFLHWALQLPYVRSKQRFKKVFRSINSRLKYARLEPYPIPRRI